MITVPPIEIFGRGLASPSELVSRGQALIFVQGRYRFQYKRGALILKAIMPLHEKQGLARETTSEPLLNISIFSGTENILSMTSLLMWQMQ